MLYNHREYEASINILNSILSSNERYYTAQYYLMLNYYKLKWWEMTLKQAKMILPYAKDYSEMITINYIINYCIGILKGTISKSEKKEIIEYKKKNKKVLKKYGIK